ncbi:NAD(P)/FAD-dependent oxidoreductase [Mycobacterium sp. CVI_P3]|uniref:NAD(P)/FAD-dependent oxidoreductase n=1 Tax=Mycobacterium pinniadriaticum TaxID=2994102 RepID=A0ABT3S9W1_9MYCO|nr:NAD(P)/FAD-dependent oxidoreductase [Mycobacterium pinniadriaticum]MCX2930043.1 NAD(P)/FAD-dependent oxidoreductase [Mycobacterium pinniadriaticum]MCX2936308.1 NAD(P)/FAD-dependent oxidoreductase [Mycobacterium pinniadriaticum]
MDAESRTAVIGAGIAGLGAARRIMRAGGTPVVFEAENRVGGRIKTVRRADRAYDVGAFIYLGSYAECTQEMLEVGLEAQMHKFDAFGAMPRSGKLNYFDLSSPLKALRTPYLSMGSKIKLTKLLRFLAKHWSDLNYTSAAGVAAIDTDTVTSYCQRELNQEILDYIAAVVVRGPWLSDPSYASVGQLLWTLKNFFKPYFYGLDDGMDAFPRAIAATLPDARLNTAVLNVADTGKGVDVTYVQNGHEHTEQFANAVICTTTGVALEIYPQMAGFAREYYQDTEYICSVNTHIALGTRPSNPATYIMCSPREQPDLCGVIVDHLKANNRCPDGQGMITTFCRHEWCLDHLDAPDDEIVEAVLRFVKPYYGDLSSQVVDYEIGRWRDVVPIMSLGRFKAVDRFMRETDPNARVHLAGDIGPIPGVNGALVSGQAAADRIMNQRKIRGRITA